MLSKARQHKLGKKLDRAPKCSILGLKTWGQGGPGPRAPGPLPGADSAFCLFFQALLVKFLQPKNLNR